MDTSSTLSARGDLEEQRRHAHAAVPMFERTGARRPLAEAYELLGRDDDAIELYREMGSVADLERIDRTRDKASRRPLLSRREAEIARHAVDGRTNLEIAAIFTLSERTVEHHMTSIYRKLKIRSRLQLARVWAAQLSENSSGD
jgi:DNA-binding CsgD family transcriptional regulator